GAETISLRGLSLRRGWSLRPDSTVTLGVAVRGPKLLAGVRPEASLTRRFLAPPKRTPKRGAKPPPGRRHLDQVRLGARVRGAAEADPGNFVHRQGAADRSGRPSARGPGRPAARRQRLGGWLYLARLSRSGGQGAGPRRDRARPGLARPGASRLHAAAPVRAA